MKRQKQKKNYFTSAFLLNIPNIYLQKKPKKEGRERHALERFTFTNPYSYGRRLFRILNKLQHSNQNAYFTDMLRRRFINNIF